MSTITVNLGVQVSGGPPISIPPHKIEGVESFQQVELLLKRLAKKDGDVTQSVSLAKNPVFFAITSDWIDVKEAEKQGWSLAYKIGDEEVKLTAPQVYLRDSALSLGEKWKDKELTVSFKKPATEVVPAAELKEVIAKVNIFIGYDLVDAVQADPKKEDPKQKEPDAPVVGP
jgi:hypothetical protein